MRVLIARITSACYDGYMKADLAKQIAEQFIDGQLPLDDFVNSVAKMATADVGEAQVDLDRARRCGFSEVVYGEGKSVEVIAKIFRSQIQHGFSCLATRVSAEQAAELSGDFPTGHYNPLGRTFRIPTQDRSMEAEHSEHEGRVVIVSAGTTDLNVAEEARETATWMGLDVTLLQDVGVAGPQRLVPHIPMLQQADALVVVAGMEGALPSVVGGHVSCPVVAVPTSVGYGANFAGLSALLGMLNSCASNVTVVNIDAGFKGAYVAGVIAQRVADARRSAAGS